MFPTIFLNMIFAKQGEINFGECILVDIFLAHNHFSQRVIALGFRGEKGKVVVILVI